MLDTEDLLDCPLQGAGGPASPRCSESPRSRAVHTMPAREARAHLPSFPAFRDALKLISNDPCYVHFVHVQVLPTRRPKALLSGASLQL